MNNIWVKIRLKNLKDHEISRGCCKHQHIPDQLQAHLHAFNCGHAQERLEKIYKDCCLIIMEIN